MNTEPDHPIADEQSGRAFAGDRPDTRRNEIFERLRARADQAPMPTAWDRASEAQHAAAMRRDQIQAEQTDEVFARMQAGDIDSETAGYELLAIDALAFGCEPRELYAGYTVARRAQRCYRARIRPSRPKPAASMMPRARQRGAGRPAVKGASRRSSARSGDSGDDSEPESEPEPSRLRLCECGCERDISHKRSHARVYDGTCRKRLARRQTAEAAADSAKRDADERWLRSLPVAEQLSAIAADVEDYRDRVEDLQRAYARLLGRRDCDCSDPIVGADLDGDPECAMCGRPVGGVGHPLTPERERELREIDRLMRQNVFRVSWPETPVAVIA